MQRTFQVVRWGVVPYLILLHDAPHNLLFAERPIRERVCDTGHHCRQCGEELMNNHACVCVHGVLCMRFEI